MTESELLSTYFEALAAINGNFEYWLSVTIGLLVAFHFAGTSISPFLKRLVIILYAITATIFFFRLINTGLTMMGLVQLLNEAETRLLVQPVGGIIIGPLYVLVMIGGSAASIYYAHIRSAKIENSELNEDET